MNRLPRRAAAIAALLVLAGCGRGHGDSPAARDGGAALEALPGAIYDPPRPAPALRLTDGDGRAFDLAQQRGRVVLVFFGFTRCRDVCPATLTQWTKVRAALGADASLVRFVFVSVDPENDLPATAGAYAQMFDRSFVGLSGTPAQIEEAALAWGVATGEAHSTQVFVVNPEGLIPWGYGRSATVDEIAEGIRRVSKS